jgi:histidine kinase
LSKLAFQNLKLRENEHLLIQFNQKLEQRVADRTAELVQKHEELNRVNEELGNAMNKLWSEMELAKKIQTVLLPKKPEISGYEIAASCEPSEEVGGDYYDVISVGGYDWIIIGDVSGHGVTSGLVMMMVQTSIHTVLIQNPQVPTSRLLSVINRTIYENIARMDEQKHITILVIACGKDGFFDFSGLHEDILLWCADTRKVERIETDGMWIGLEADISGMPVSEFRLCSGDCIVLYTDGIIEAWSQGIGFFGIERLIKVIGQFGDKSAAEIHAAILDALKDYEKPDDVTLFVMKRV